MLLTVPASMGYYSGYRQELLCPVARGQLARLDLAERGYVVAARDKTAPDTVELNATRWWQQLGTHWQRQRLALPAPDHGIARHLVLRPVQLRQTLLRLVRCLPRPLTKQVGAVDWMTGQEWREWREWREW